LDDRREARAEGGRQLSPSKGMLQNFEQNAMIYTVKSVREI